MVSLIKNVELSQEFEKALKILVFSKGGPSGPEKCELISQICPYFRLNFILKLEFKIII